MLGVIFKTKKYSFTILIEGTKHDRNSGLSHWGSINAITSEKKLR